MYTAIITWMGIVGFLMLFMTLNICRSLYKLINNRHIIEVGSENDEFYVPGDEYAEYEDVL